MSDIVTIAGSPSLESRSSILLSYLGKLVENEGLSVKNISVLDVDPAVLINAQVHHPSVVEITENIQKAKGVIISSPVYKAAYSGVLKALLDLLPQDIFKGKPVYPLMVGGSKSHLLAIDFSLKPLLATLHAQTILRGVYLTDAQIEKSNLLKPIIDSELEERVNQQLHQLVKISKKLEGN
ncbi:NADPH-dependent FMN reductase [Metabacillus arenae]|uniref:NADPH-dependent FMN reductase n=1 Tax=Metabacillus arenae TaxID=2771434 RepID=A0A926RXU8_9BACI|nr:NADPH-dependent FMN reductase [Metabacillus arenae]MBD1381065.1 NADPH-dependent FMN reductase [Metabacillus arenae]